jgi:hypothetical protein
MSASVIDDSVGSEAAAWSPETAQDSAEHVKARKSLESNIDIGYPMVSIV